MRTVNRAAVSKATTPHSFRFRHHSNPVGFCCKSTMFKGGVRQISLLEVCSSLTPQCYLSFVDGR